MTGLAVGWTNGACVLRGTLAGIGRDWLLEHPPAGAAIGGGVALFHDGARPDLKASLADDGLVLAVDDAGCSYVSLAVDMPGEVRARLGPGWRLRVRLVARATRPVTTHLRLNLDHRHGRAALHEIVVIERGRREAVFDLDAVAHRDWSSAWLDVLFCQPRLCEVRLSGLMVSFDELG